MRKGRKQVGGMITTGMVAGVGASIGSQMGGAAGGYLGEAMSATAGQLPLMGTVAGAGMTLRATKGLLPKKKLRL